MFISCRETKDAKRHVCSVAGRPFSYGPTNWSSVIAQAFFIHTVAGLACYSLREFLVDNFSTTRTIAKMVSLACSRLQRIVSGGFYPLQHMSAMQCLKNITFIPCPFIPVECSAYSPTLSPCCPYRDGIGSLYRQSVHPCVVRCAYSPTLSPCCPCR